MFGLRYPFSLGLLIALAIGFGFGLLGLAKSADVSFAYSEDLTFVLTLLICSAAATISFFTYRRSGDLLSNGMRLGLGIFRFLVLTAIGMLLLEPRKETNEKILSPPVIAVLQDNSESLVIQKDSNFVRNEFPRNLGSFMTELSGGKAETQFFTFSQLLDKDASYDSLAFQGTGTNISGALDGVRKLYANQNLGAVVLITDGIPTSGMSPLYALSGFQQPVYTVMLGDTTPQKDILIAEVLYNEIAYLENETPVKVKLNSTGYQEQDLVVSISYRGKTLETKQVKITQERPGLDVDFLVTPDQTGVRQYVVSVTRLEDEITHRNNSKSLFINVLETKVKVALFAGFPHPDVGALTQAMARDQRYSVTEFIHKKPNSWYESPDDYNLSEFDLIILHNFPFSPADAKVADKIATVIRDQKKPVMHFIGQYTHLNTLDQSLGEFTGLKAGAVSTVAEEAQLSFKQEYTEHSTHTFEEDWIRIMNNAPPLFRNKSDWQPKGDTKVFGTARIKNILLDYPVYALQNHLGRKNFCLVGENVWRMRSHSLVETGDFEAFDTWLYNNIQWLMVREDKRRFKVKPSKPLFTGNEPILFRGEAYDDSYNPLPGVDVRLSIRNAKGKENNYYLNESSNGRYFLELRNLEEGTYQYQAEGSKNDVRIGTDRGEFSIGKSNIEHFRLQADQNLLEQIALRTDGKYVSARNLNTLAQEILNLPSLKPTSRIVTQRSGFNEYTWLFFILIGLLALEWVIRKRFSLV